MGHYFTNDDVKSNLRKIKVNISDKSFNFYTDNGVFSKQGLDFGSRVLINTLLKENLTGDMLDMGCGYGSIGLILSSFFNLKVDLVDVNKRAIHLTKMNVKENNISLAKVFYSDGYNNIKDKYDIIVTNPPIRAGKEIVYKMLFEARFYLKDSGVLYLVINKNQGAKTVCKDLERYYKVEILEKSKGFFVIKCIFG